MTDQYFQILLLYNIRIQNNIMLGNLDKNLSIGPETGDGQPQCKKIQDYVYRFSDQIGMGNFSKVYKGLHQTTNKQVAIKIIELSSLTNNRLQQLLNSQTKILKQLSHPNVISCQQILSSVRNCYIITQLCNGGDLEKKLKKVGSFKQKQLYSIATDIYQGLKYLSKKHIIHRDIKVSNIFINNGVYKIADFGFAQISQVQFKDISVGSPIYMSPQGYINNIYGPKTDVWAFGALLFELAQGKTPYHDSRTQTQLKQRLLKQIDQESFSSNISADLKNLIIQCLQINPNKRIRAADIENTVWMKKAVKALSQPVRTSQKQNILPHNPNSHIYRKTTDNFTGKNTDHKIQNSFSNTTTNANTIRLQEPYIKNYLQKYNSFFKNQDRQKLKVKQREKQKQNQWQKEEKRKNSDEKQQNKHRRKHSTLDKTIRQSKDEQNSGENKNNESNKIFYSPKNAILKFEKTLGFRSASPTNNKIQLLNYKNMTNPTPSTNANSNTSSNNNNNNNYTHLSCNSTNRNHAFNQNLNNDSTRLGNANVNSNKSVQQNSLNVKMKSVWLERMPNNLKQTTNANRQNFNNSTNFNTANCSHNTKYYKDNHRQKDKENTEKQKPKDKQNNIFFNNFLTQSQQHKQRALKQFKNHKQDFRDRNRDSKDRDPDRDTKKAERLAIVDQYKNYLTATSNTASSFQKYEKCNTRVSQEIHVYKDKQRQRDKCYQFQHKILKTPHGAINICQQGLENKLVQNKSHLLTKTSKLQINNNLGINLKNEKKLQKKSNSHSQLSKIITRPLKFGDCIGLIHYCRLCYKFASLIDESNQDEQSKQFLNRWCVQLLMELNNKIKDGEILYGNQTCLMNNPSMNPDEDKQKKKKLKDVIEQYLNKYNQIIRNSEKALISLKQASNFIYNLYLVKGHQFKQRVKDKKAYLYYALICYLSVLDKQTRNLMQYTYEIKSSLQGRQIQKLLSIKKTEFNKKSIEEITNQENQNIVPL